MVLVVRRVVFCMFHVMTFFTSLFGLQGEICGAGWFGFKGVCLPVVS